MLELNKDTLWNFLKDRFPDADISFFGEGWTSLAFLIDRKILRFPKKESVLKRYEREIRILDLLRPFTDTPIPAPRMVTDGPFCYVEHECLPGKYWGFAEFESLPASTQDVLASDCAAFLYQVHSVNFDLAKRVIVETKIGPTPVDPVPKDVILGILGDRIPKDTFDAIYDKYLDVVDLPPGTDYCVCHNDFKGTNTVIDDRHRLCGVFDFVNANISERAAEFKYFYNPKYPTFLEKMLWAYEKISGIRIDIDRIKALCLRDTFNGMRNLGAPHLESIRESALKTRVQRMLYFA